MREIGRQTGASAKGGRQIPVVRFGDRKRPLWLDAADIGNPDRPICFGPFAIGCYVLSNGARILEHESVARAIGIGRFDPPAARRAMLRFVGAEASGSTEVPDWRVRLVPIPFRRSAKGRLSYGWDPDIVHEFCTAAGSLTMLPGLSRQDMTIVERCAVLSLVFDRYGEVIGKVDEVTGYARHQQRNLAARLLEPLVSPSTRPWLGTLPIEFYEELCRLSGHPFLPFLHLPAQAAGHIDLLFRGWLIAGHETHWSSPASPANEGRRSGRERRGATGARKGFDRTTALREQLSALIALMRASAGWEELKALAGKSLVGRQGAPLGDISSLLD